MKKITEAELSRRVNSLREKLISEEIRPFGSHDESITRDPGVDPSISLSKMLPALRDVTRLTTHNGQVVAVNPAGLIRGVYDGQNSWKAGQGMPDNLQNVTVPVATPVAPPTPITGTDLPPLEPTAVATPVAPQTPNNATNLPPLAPVAAPVTAVTPVAAPTNVPRDANGVNIANKPVGDSAAKVSSPAAVPVDPRDGPTGQTLARMGISKQNRLDQAFVDRMLGAGKYKAGSAESNLALLKTKPAGDTIDVPKQIERAPAPILPKPAPVTGTGSGGGRGPTAQQFTSDWNNKMKAAQKLGWPDSTTLPPADWAPLGKPVTGKNKMAPDLKEAVTYADDQTLARIVSLSRR